MKEEQEIIEELEHKIKETQERFNAGKTILIQVKQQLKVLKNKLKEYERIKGEVKFSSAADGDL